MKRQITADEEKMLVNLNRRSQGFLPGLIGIEIKSVDMELKTIESQLEIREQLLAPNGYLHAATVVALADTTCGYGTICNLPAKAHSFTTIELKSNFLGTEKEGFVSCKAQLIHAGKTTQIWDATVRNQADKKISLFRCTQLLLYKPAGDV